MTEIPNGRKGETMSEDVTGHRRELSQVSVSLVISGDDLAIKEITDTVGRGSTSFGLRNDCLGPHYTTWEYEIGDTYPFPFENKGTSLGDDVPYPAVMMCLSNMQSQLQDRTVQIRDYCRSRGLGASLVVTVVAEGQRYPVLDLSAEFLQFAAHLGASLSYRLKLDTSIYSRPAGAVMSYPDVRAWTRKLLTAQTKEEDEDACNHLRGRVVRQGSVYQSGEWFVQECLAVIGQGGVTDMGVGDALDIVIEIVEGGPDPVEIAWGNTGVVDRCQAIVRGYTPLLVRLADSDDEFVVFDAVELLSVVSEDKVLVMAVAQKAAGRTLKQRSVRIHENFLFLLREILQDCQRPGFGERNGCEQ